MKRIVIFSPTSQIIDIHNPELLGGADKGLIQLIKILSKHYSVTAYIPIKKYEVIDDIKYKPFMDIFLEPQRTDIFIMYRKAWVLPYTISTEQSIFYSRDDTDSPCFICGKDSRKMLEVYNKVIAISNYHRKRINKQFKIKKSYILGNGTEEQTMSEKSEQEFIYASTPFRGLVYLAKIWKSIIEKYPEAKLHVFSSMSIYGAGEEHERIFEPLYEKLKEIKGVVYHGSRPRTEMLECMKKCKLLLYPNNFPETYCNVIMEARACKTPFITSDLGALPETGGLAGFYIKGHPKTKEYQEEFLKIFEAIMTNDKLYNHLQDQCEPIRTWEQYEKELIQIIED